MSFCNTYHARARTHLHTHTAKGTRSSFEQGTDSQIKSIFRDSIFFGGGEFRCCRPIPGSVVLNGRPGTIGSRHGRRVRQTRSRVKYVKTGTSQLCASGRRLIPGAEARVITPARKQCGSGRNVAPARESRISVALQAEAALHIVDSVDDLLMR